MVYEDDNPQTIERVGVFVRNPGSTTTEKEPNQTETTDSTGTDTP
jgi:hypothetical protein